MKKNLEIEYKTLISETEYKTLQTQFDFSVPLLQTNVYYDTPNKDLFKNKMMCRIRIIENRFEFTLKIPQENGVMEFECLLDSLSLNDKRITDYFNTLAINSLSLAETSRSETLRSVHTDIYGDWCLDKNHFAHHHDLELEYELHEPNEKAYPHYLDTLKRLNINYKTALPKYIRALNSGQ